ncbi:MAG: hypothetical protein HYR84_06125 [Planctomycetes bacterium]|nr:hypothetical protein [Planctomycetota bacterium]
MSVQARLYWTAGAGCAAASIAIGGEYALGFSISGILLIVAVALAFAFAIVAWFSTEFYHRCTYVGDRGIAWIECTGARDNLTFQNVLVFANAKELRSMTIDDAQYGWTEFNYRWVDARLEPLFEVDGRINQERKKVTVHHSSNSYRKESFIRNAGRQEKMGWQIPAFLPSL